jgi:hypothetical protein
MKKGKEPLRTFGDLLQFYELKQEPRVAPKSSQPPAELTVPPAAETPAAEIENVETEKVETESLPTNGDSKTNVETPEPNAIAREVPPTNENPAESSESSEN